MELLNQSLIRLNIGAGNKTIEGFLNLGLDPHHDIAADIRDLSMIETNTVAEAVAYHVLEHLWRWEAPMALAEWFRVLTPGGKLAIEMPELLRCARAVLEGHPDRNGMKGLFGDARGPEFMTHKYCYSEAELKDLLRSVGFIKIKLCIPQTHGKRQWRDMRVECVKPLSAVDLASSPDSADAFGMAVTTFQGMDVATEGALDTTQIAEFFGVPMPGRNIEEATDE